jgi:hypothetical protein
VPRFITHGSTPPGPYKRNIREVKIGEAGEIRRGEGSEDDEEKAAIEGHEVGTVG